MSSISNATYDIFVDWLFKMHDFVLAMFAHALHELYYWFTIIIQGPFDS